NRYTPRYTAPKPQAGCGLRGDRVFPRHMLARRTTVLVGRTLERAHRLGEYPSLGASHILKYDPNPALVRVERIFRGVSSVGLCAATDWGWIRGKRARAQAEEAALSPSA